MSRHRADQEPTLQEPTLQEPTQQDPWSTADPAGDWERAVVDAEHAPPFVLATSDSRLVKVDGTAVSTYDEDAAGLAQDLLDGVTAPVATDLTLEQVRAHYER